MKKQFVALLFVALSPTAAFADKNIISGSATWDCAKDATVNIVHGKGSYTFKGTCKEVNVQGGGNRITAEAIDELNIQGGDNTVTVGTIDQINIVGSNNRVTFKKAKSGDKPSQSVVGNDNKIIGGGGAADAPADKPADKPAPTNDKGGTSGAIDCSKQPVQGVNTTGGNSLRYIGTCDKISVGTGANHLQIENVKELVLNGGENVVEIGGVDKIVMNGAENRVTYKKGLTVAKPKVGGGGADNTAVQVK